MANPSVRIRFAPSPTGYLHIGGLRTALYCFLVARGLDGGFILRIEDTDRTRYVPDAEQDILDSLGWVGLMPDEGPAAGGASGPYRQSERTYLYLRHVERLLASGHAYHAFDTPDALEAMRAAMGAAAGYDSTQRQRMCNALTLPRSDVDRRLSRGDSHVIRFRTPDEGSVRFTDLVKGEVEIPVHSIDDQVLLKSDGMPTYHLANVVDDHLMQISHVIRGEEWLPSAPKHILLYRALGWTPPQMAHLPLILSPSGGKLSKRNAARQGIPVSVRDYRAAGYEPEAVVNFLVFLGWNPATEEEIFSLGDLIGRFSLQRVGTSGVRFSLDKLRWFNQQHLRRLSPNVLIGRLRPFLERRGLAADDAYLLRVAALVGDRLHLAEELVTTYAYLFQDPVTYDEKGVQRRWKADSPRLLAAYADRLSQLQPFSEAELEAALRVLTAEFGVGAGRLIHPARLAVSGTTAGPSLFGMLEVLGRTTCVRRIQHALGAMPAQT